MPATGSDKAAMVASGGVPCEVNRNAVRRGDPAVPAAVRLAADPPQSPLLVTCIYQSPMALRLW